MTTNEGDELKEVVSIVFLATLSLTTFSIPLPHEIEK